MIWISTKQSITPAEGLNAYMNKYAYKYTYICICDSFIIGKFGSVLQFEKIGCYTRFDVHPITKVMFHSKDQTRQLNCNFPYEYTTAKLVVSCPFHYKNTYHFTLLHFSLVYLTSTCHLALHFQVCHTYTLILLVLLLTTSINSS
jgi:hypothetical protein